MNTAANQGGSTPERPDYDEIRVQLVRSVSRVCPRWLADRKEDIVQAALMRLIGLERRGEHDPRPAASYLWKVAYSTTVDEIRRIRRRQEVSLNQEDQDTSGPTAPESPLRDQSSRELGLAIQGCLQTLVEPRRLVVGFYLLGHDLAESEKLTGWDGKRVRNLLYRGLGNLRQCLTTKGFTP